MDRNEAIRVIEELLADRDNDSTYPCVSSPRHYEALDLAIEALRQTESEDCISKHDLWRIIEDNAYWVTYNETSKEKGMTLTGINQALNECPPVTPTERTGEWVDREHCQVDEDAYDVAICSNCKTEITLKYPCDNYCPNCGAKMGGDTK